MTSNYVLDEALMDCVATPDSLLRPHVGGSPFNLARAASLRGASVAFLNRFSQDRFGQLAADLGAYGQWARDGVPQVRVIDTVGAGDTFWGNCLADWTLQLDNAAAINCTRVGCQPPTQAELFGQAQQQQQQ